MVPTKNRMRLLGVEHNIDMKELEWLDYQWRQELGHKWSVSFVFVIQRSQMLNCKIFNVILPWYNSTHTFRFFSLVPWWCLYRHLLNTSSILLDMRFNASCSPFLLSSERNAGRKHHLPDVALSHVCRHPPALFLGQIARDWCSWWHCDSLATDYHPLCTCLAPKYLPTKWVLQGMCFYCNLPLRFCCLFHQWVSR